MKGTVLHADGGSGILRAEDGRRYGFAAGEWKSPKPPAAGDHVDFEPVGTAATALYVVKGGMAPIDVAALKGSLASAAQAARRSNVGAMLLADWRPLLAAATLLACLLPYASVGQQSAMLLTVPSHAGEAIDALAIVRGLGRGAPDVGGLILALRLTYLLWLVPLAAAALLFCVFTGRPVGQPTLVHGAISIAVPILVAVAGAIMIASSLPPELRQGGRGSPVNVGLFGIGAWLIVGLGALQLAAHFGLLKKSPRDLVRRP